MEISELGESELINRINNKIKLSSKDIAIMNGLELNTVNVTRYRLRRKLGLSRSVNLADYFQHV